MQSSGDEKPHACARNPMDAMPARVGGHGGGSQSWRDRGGGGRRGIDWPLVKERVDLAAVATDLLGAPRRTSGSGRLWWVCPFHNDHKPSFCITPGRSEWRCFGCGAHGDAASLLMQWNGITFPEAVRVLADRVGWPTGRHHRPAPHGAGLDPAIPGHRLLADDDEERRRRRARRHDDDVAAPGADGAVAERCPGAGRDGQRAALVAAGGRAPEVAAPPRAQEGDDLRGEPGLHGRRDGPDARRPPFLPGQRDRHPLVRRRPPDDGQDPPAGRQEPEVHRRLPQRTGGVSVAGDGPAGARR